MINIDHIHWRHADFSLAIEGIQLANSHNLAIIGQNGSGKTLFLETLLGLRASVKATVSVGDSNDARPQDSHRIQKSFKDQSILAKTGAQLQNSAFPSAASIADVLDLQKKLYGKLCNELEKVLDIRALQHKRYGNCSLGEKRRIDLFFAAAHRPQYFFLDEPLSGLDANYSDAFIGWWQSHY